MPTDLITWSIDYVISGHGECLLVSLAAALYVDLFCFSPHIFNINLTKEKSGMILSLVTKNIMF